MKFTLEIDGEKELLGALNRFNIAQGLRVSDAIRESAKAMVAAARSRSPKKGGKLRRSIKYKMDRDGFGAEVGTRLWYARFIEFGTVAHRIAPRRAKALKFPDGFAANATHPGQPARPFIRPSFDQETPRYAKRMRDALERAAKQSGAK